MMPSPKTIDPSRVLFPLGLGTALSLMGDATLYTVLPTHSAEAGITLSAVGILLSVNRIIRLFLNGPAGIAYDRSPRRPLFIPALFIGALSTAIYAVDRGFWPLLTGRLLWGLAWSGIWVGGTTIILDITKDRNRGRWTGLYQTWFFIGSAIGALAGGLLTDLVGYQTTMWIGAGVTALGGIQALFLLPETQDILVDSVSRMEITNPASWQKNPPLLSAVTVQGINRFVIAGILAGTIALVVQEHLTPISPLLGVATITGLLMASRTFLSILAAPLAGNLSDKLGSRWVVTLGGAILGTLGMLLISLSTTISILMGIFLGAVAGGSLQALTTTITGDSAQHSQRGRAVGLLHTAGDLGSALGPLTAYAFLPWIGLSGLYFISAGLFALAGLLAFVAMVKERRR